VEFLPDSGDTPTANGNTIEALKAALVAERGRRIVAETEAAR
jgi:hypothetical protein